MNSRTPTRPVGSIRIGPRHRHFLGDLTGLVASINARGLLHPIPVLPDGTMICGLRRITAWKLSDRRREPIPYHVVDIDSILDGEHDENTHRLALTPSETVVLMRDLVPAFAEAARTRQAVLGRHHGRVPDGDPLAKITPEGGTRGRTRDLVAKVLGTSHRTLEKMAAVHDAAELEPEAFDRLRVDMNRTGNVHGPYKRLVVMRRAREIRAEPPPLPGRGPYRVIAADPPWPFDRDVEDPSERGTHPYPQMSYAAIRALPVRELAAEDSVLWLWTTNHHLSEAFSVVAAWGFAPRTMLTWVKDRIGRGQYLREQTEHCILAIRGSPVIQLGAESTVLHAARLEHSRKPDAFYGLVERICPAPGYAELFAHHQRRPGWDTHSTEILEGAPAPIGASGERDEVAA